MFLILFLFLLYLFPGSVGFGVGFWISGLTKGIGLGYNAYNIAKALKRRVGFGYRSESPGWWEGVRKEIAEHGLGAGVSMRPSRVCPLQLLR
jgi:hypothetical protein